MKRVAVLTSAGNSPGMNAATRAMARRVPVIGEGERVVGTVTLDDMMKLHAEQAGALLDVISKGQAREGRACR